MSTTARPSERLVPENSADQPALRMDRFRDQEDRLRGACSSRPYLRSEKKRVAKRMAGAIRSGYSRAFQLHGSPCESQCDGRTFLPMLRENVGVQTFPFICFPVDFEVTSDALACGLPNEGALAFGHPHHAKHGLSQSLRIPGRDEHAGVANEFTHTTHVRRYDRLLHGHSFPNHKRHALPCRTKDKT